MADFSIKSHDQLPALRVKLIDEVSKNAVDLTTATLVEFIMTTAAGVAPVINSAAVIEAPFTDGIVRYDWKTTDTATVGSFIGEFEVTWAGGKKQTFPTGAYLTIDIKADLDGA